MEISNKKIPEGEFMDMRREVLNQWPTGREVDLDEAVEYHKSLPENKVFTAKLNAAKAEHRTLVQPRAGVPVIEEHIKLLQYLQNNGEADLLPTTIDSYTRQNRYEEAENGINESLRLNRAMLNGFPAVNHGVSGCRRIRSFKEKAARAAPLFTLKVLSQSFGLGLKATGLISLGR